MSNEPNLWTRDPEPAPVAPPTPKLPPAPHNGTPTSRAAAEAIEPTRQTQCGKVLAYIRAQGARGATRHEAAKALDMPLASVCGRFDDLRRYGGVGVIVEPEGMTRLNESGRHVQVAIAKEFFAQGCK